MHGDLTSQHASALRMMSRHTLQAGVQVQRELSCAALQVPSQLRQTACWPLLSLRSAANHRCAHPVECNVGPG